MLGCDLVVLEMRHTPTSLADVLEKQYSPMQGGAKLYLSEYEWRMVIAALRGRACARCAMQEINDPRCAQVEHTCGN
jgi:hypothetical protein